MLAESDCTPTSPTLTPAAAQHESAPSTSPPSSPSGTVATFVDDHVVSVRLFGGRGDGRRAAQSKRKASTSDVGNTLSNAETLVDAFDASSEEPFTLERYDMLVIQHAEAGKDFIIARVTTMDPLDEMRMYHSHYAAHQLNKILFRTQPHEGLLHRMKAKNPLNNMPIVGDVLYYAVKAKSVSSRKRDAETASIRSVKVSQQFESIEHGEISATAPLEEGKFADTKITIDNVDEDVPTVPQTAVVRPESPGPLHVESLEMRNDAVQESEQPVEIAPPPKAFQPPESRGVTDAQRTSPMSISHEGSAGEQLNRRSSQTSISTMTTPSSPKNPSSPTSPLPTFPASPISSSRQLPNLSYDAYFFATDEDFLMRSSTRNYFKTNALDPADAQLFTVSSSSQTAISPRRRTTNPIRGTPPTTQLEWMIGQNGVRNGSFGSLPVAIASLERRHHPPRPGQQRGCRCDMSSVCYNRRLKWMLILYVLFGFLMIKFVVNEAYAYLVAFLLMMGLFLAFCIGSGMHMSYR